jgi:nucleotidyltransferase substrate binding protein (TIGR01987 family)
MTHRDLISHLDRSTNALASLEQALAWLKKVRDDDVHYMIHVDASVKRFETLFEYMWKLLKSASEYQGVEAPGPRPAIQQAVRFGWITDPEFWANTMDIRNGTVHDYFGVSVEQLLGTIKQFAKEVTVVIQRIKKLSTA